MSYIKTAFDAICKDAKIPRSHYVALIESCPFYGGPEEGGWWGSDEVVRAYKQFSSSDEANRARDSLLNLADELEKESLQEFGDQCLKELDWLEARGLEPDWLREPDGESHFCVIVKDSIPENNYGCRHYE